MLDVASNPSDAVEEALDRFGDDILRLAYSYMKSREDAEDIVQDVLIRFMQSAKTFSSEEHVKAWLFRVAINLCKDKLKSASRQREVALPEGYEVEAASSTNEDESEIIQLIWTLAEKYRSVIHLYYFEEYSTAEIAEILQKKESTVRSLLKRGREKLEKMMKGDEGYAERV